ncbi:AGAP008799-PA, partial [Anopheles gambiae str. PEST]
KLAINALTGSENFLHENDVNPFIPHPPVSPIHTHTQRRREGKPHRKGSKAKKRSEIILKKVKGHIQHTHSNPCVCETVCGATPESDGGTNRHQKRRVSRASRKKKLVVTLLGFSFAKENISKPPLWASSSPPFYLVLLWLIAIFHVCERARVCLCV